MVKILTVAQPQPADDLEAVCAIVVTGTPKKDTTPRAVFISELAGLIRKQAADTLPDVVAFYNFRWEYQWFAPDKTDKDDDNPLRGTHIYTGYADAYRPRAGETDSALYDGTGLITL